MKKVLRTIATLSMASVLCFMATACGEKLNFGKEYVAKDSQLDAVMEVKKSSADVAIIDSIMANYYVASSEFKDVLAIVPNLTLATETFGIAAKKSNEAVISKINEALIALADTSVKTLATTDTYDISGDILVKNNTVNPQAAAADDSWTKLAASKKVIIGYTLYAPIAYEEGTTLTGYDIELARAAFAYLNEKYSTEIVIDFQPIVWGAKETLIENGSIDLLWNGLTITEDRSAEWCISVPYLANKQFAVIRKADKDLYKTTADMSNAIICAEGGSAGESVVVKK